MSDLSKIDSVAGISIYSVKGTPQSFLFKAGMAIDADGSPRAYGPNNSGIDYTANGGDPGPNKNPWWGGPTNPDNSAVVQQIIHPYPGLYVSAVALLNPAYSPNSPYAYPNSETTPFIVLPGKHSNGAKLGDVCLCLNTKTGDNCYGIYADVGPTDSIGEASIRMAQALKIPDDPKTGGTASKTIAYLVFPGSIGKWTPPETWWAKADDIVKAWGGLSRLKELASEI
jgi:Fungal chitosanase of glycosyl hydrolase group 75